MTDKEIDRIIKANIKMAGFISLVKRMREAQKKFGEEVDVCIGFEEGLNKMYYLEDRVDEFLNSIEI